MVVPVKTFEPDYSLSSNLLASRINILSQQQSPHLLALKEINLDQGHIQISFNRALNSEQSKILLKKIINGINNFLTTAPVDSCHVNEVKDYIENRSLLERIVRKLVDRVVHTDQINFKYFIVTDADSKTNNVIMLLEVDANVSDLNKIKKVIKKLQEEFQIAIKVKNITSTTTERTVPIAKFERVEVKKTDKACLFIDDQTMKPLITIDNPGTYRMEDGFFVRRLNKDLFYVSVHVPLRAEGRSLLPLEEYKKVLSLSVEFFYDIKNRKIENPNVSLANIQSHARLSYNQIDENWGTLNNITQIGEHYLASDIIRNIEEALIISRDWSRSRHNNSEFSGKIGNLIIAQLIHMSQVAFSQFMAEKGIPVVGYVFPEGDRPKYFIQNDDYLLGAKSAFKNGEDGVLNQQQFLHALYPDIFKAFDIQAVQQVVDAKNRRFN
jgi:hypothetical protein